MSCCWAGSTTVSVLPLRLQWQREGLCRGDCPGSQSRTTRRGRCRSRRLSSGVLPAARTAVPILRRLGRIREPAAKGSRPAALRTPGGCFIECSRLSGGVRGRCRAGPVSGVGCRFSLNVNAGVANRAGLLAAGHARSAIVLPEGICSVQSTSSDESVPEPLRVTGLVHYFIDGRVGQCPLTTPHDKKSYHSLGTSV
jgi:hypothetical protein